jgi:sensor histidine kinase regulating citrate/malate metabolism
MPDAEHENELGELIHLAMEGMGVAVSIIDPQGTLLYYNKESAKILDRKPGYIGTDIHSHHKKTDSNQKLDLMLKNFEAGRKDPFHYQAKPYGKTILVTLSPIIKNDRFIGCVQTVRLKNTVSEHK